MAAELLVMVDVFVSVRGIVAALLRSCVAWRSSRGSVAAWPMHGLCGACAAWMEPWQHCNLAAQHLVHITQQMLMAVT